uniref:Uncharacterized protein n=1 Tax=Rhizophora mucronata TaxID=61149 RepID=A0A2P2ILT8_RHIMU
MPHGISKGLYQLQSKQNPRWQYNENSSHQNVGIHLYLVGNKGPMSKLKVSYMSCRQNPKSLISQELQLCKIPCKL